MEVAFFEENFSASSVEKYNLHTQNLWAKSDALSDGDSFSLTLSVEEMYSNISENQYVFIKVYEGDSPNERWLQSIGLRLLLRLVKVLLPQKRPLRLVESLSLMEMEYVSGQEYGLTTL